MPTLKNNQYKFLCDLKSNKGPISSILFNCSATLVFIGSDDGHIRIYSTKDFALVQTLHELAWGKVTALAYLDHQPSASNRVEVLCVGSIRGSVSLIPQANQNTVHAPIKLGRFADPDQSGSPKVYDAANQQLVIASHGGTLKLFSVDGGVDLIKLWTIAEPLQAIPISLAFFGGGNQSLLVHKIENGEMTCQDAQTSEVLWQNGHAALSLHEDLLVHNLTESYMQVSRSLPEAVFPVNFQRQITFQGTWAEDRKIAVCGSDHDTIYVLDVVMQEVVQQLPARDNHHVIIGGSSSGSFCASVWTKQPAEPLSQPVAVCSATFADKWLQTAEQGVILFLFLAMIVMVVPHEAEESTPTGAMLNEDKEIGEASVLLTLGGSIGAIILP
ncbi:hypothetical protein C0995_001730 [Termitomyces sp. Mi166|nr:hypothetical protein C0995_001730 [Termitomyces sp. Mi166\